MSNTHFHILGAKTGGAEVNHNGRLNVRAVGGNASISIHHPTDEQVADALAAGASLRPVTSEQYAVGFFYTLDMNVMGIEISMFPDTEQVWKVASGEQIETTVAA